MDSKILPNGFNFEELSEYSSLPYEEQTFDIKVIGMNRRVPEFNFVNKSMEVIRDEYDHYFTARLRAFVISDTKTKPIIIRYPDGWFEALKEKFLFGVFKSKFPVRYKEIIIDPEHVYPEYPIPNLGKRITFLHQRDSR